MTGKSAARSSASGAERPASSASRDEAAKTGGGRFGSTRGPGVAAESTLRLKSVAAARNRWRMIVKVGTSPMWRTQPAIVP